ncbi:helix-turn-helix domain-containing protein [Ponticoccus sp. SC2-23]|uniref:helix-turn-helix domain-containing protein n=1 Tax=Alexandriicola marinus TaxID=2081710 RepID=UPI000FDA33A7|nr:helix-turn-helix domain-containing protein [Alexandriicola marinus]MBM1220986.1 helix-turn-helix domain-containing protein [Ponticoccus sp. SC6-9]MBM1225556.1 helix-turn-helix domain-containing protein [Ponticoccus sp. SC6-15]MBM1231881.1 helix-turn-helix domain-containing protein [Ponticoccus sp. SC6-38]MBM1236398.1 helix-turn-helix domain-containing protein [Ponticoccus sp. SC6-45]MBM1240903.1 helix-turn-helix domain-containing protein [Ponticoccus sp. SC6-49]MBM1243479.1 helix-turn-heli
MADNPNTPNDHLPERLTERELARHWRISQRTLQRWREAGAGPSWYRIGGRVLYGRNDVRDFENASRFPGAAP